MGVTFKNNLAVARGPTVNGDVAPVCFDIIRNYLLWQVEQVFTESNRRCKEILNDENLRELMPVQRHYRDEYDKVFWQAKTDIINIFDFIWRCRINSSIVGRRMELEFAFLLKLSDTYCGKFLNHREKLFGDDDTFLYPKLLREARIIGNTLKQLLSNLDTNYKFFSAIPEYDRSRLWRAVEYTTREAPESEREVLFHGFTQ